ncbi:unnamed protein product [Phaedon cochleariae]|uniref:Uncharacterized protein n=1 Tax=Phaedon cochleariae TaxID=80249 RepID=A0A9N9SBH2_PHACE|nr:unnamed protein product [Phaedon cochleariae]
MNYGGSEDGKWKENQPVPKVIVMGSSTASENTINTSTDSSNTIVTTVTATDGEATEDSLDFPELDIFASENILDNSKMPNAILEPIPVSPKTPATAKQRTPPTGKRTDTKFTFEVHNSKNSIPMEELTPKRDDRFIYDNDTYSQKSTVDSLMEEQIEALKLEARRRNSYRQAAQNLDVIEVMSEDRNGCQMSPKEHRRSFKKKLDVDKQKREKTSPKRRAERAMNSSPEDSDSPKPKHREHQRFQYLDKSKGVVKQQRGILNKNLHSLRVSKQKIINRQFATHFNDFPDTQASLFSRKADLTVPNISMSGVTIPLKTSIPLLGITISNNLSWENHVRSIAKSASQKLGFLFRARSYFTSSQLLMIYKAQIRPVLEYCSHIWSAEPKHTLKLLDSVQKRAIHLVGDASLTNSLTSLTPRTVHYKLIQTWI